MLLGVFVLWLPKRSPTKLDLFAQLFQHYWGHAHGLRMFSKVLWGVSLPWCTAGLNIVGDSCICLLTRLPTRTQQLPTLLVQQCLEVITSVLLHNIQILLCLKAREKKGIIKLKDWQDNYFFIFTIILSTSILESSVWRTSSSVPINDLL